jgi:hypothetical protein
VVRYGMGICYRRAFVAGVVGVGIGNWIHRYSIDTGVTGVERVVDRVKPVEPSRGVGQLWAAVTRRCGQWGSHCCDRAPTCSFRRRGSE